MVHILCWGHFRSCWVLFPKKLLQRVWGILQSHRDKVTLLLSWVSGCRHWVVLHPYIQRSCTVGQVGVKPSLRWLSFLSTDCHNSHFSHGTKPQQLDGFRLRWFLLFWMSGFNALISFFLSLLNKNIAFRALEFDIEDIAEIDEPFFSRMSFPRLRNEPRA